VQRLPAARCQGPIASALFKGAHYPAAGSEDTELGIMLEPEVGHRVTEILREFRLEAVKLITTRSRPHGVCQPAPRRRQPSQPSQPDFDRVRLAPPRAVAPRDAFQRQENPRIRQAVAGTHDTRQCPFLLQTQHLFSVPRVASFRHQDGGPLKNAAKSNALYSRNQAIERLPLSCV
jgi:hypothetical protein